MLEETYDSCLLPLDAERPIEQVFYDISKAVEQANG